MKRLRKIVGYGLLAVVQILLACLVVDVAFRKYENEFVYAHAPRDAASYSLKTMLLNDHGDFIARKKAPDEYRVLVFGDSYAYAVTKPEYGFCAALERRLAAAHPDRRVRVVNLGFPSTSFPQYLEQFYFWTQALEYDAVVFDVYLGNDFNDVRDTPYDPKAFAAALGEQCRLGMAYGPYTLVPHQYWFRFMDFIKAKILFTLQSNAELRRMLGLPDLEKIGQLPEGTDPRYASLLPLTPAQLASEMRSHLRAYVPRELFGYAPALPWFQQLLAVAAGLEASGRPVMVMLSPSLSIESPVVREQAARDLGVPLAEVDATLPGRVAAELAGRVGLSRNALIDLTPVFGSETPSGENAYTGVETHWSPAGNAWAGELVGDCLAARWFGRGDAAAACPSPVSAGGVVPERLLPPVAPQKALATSILSGCAAH